MFTKVEVLRHMTYTFLCGIAIVAGFDMARQDTMGLEGYIQYMRIAWIDTPVWLGYVLCLLNIAFVAEAYRRVVKKEEPWGISMRGTGMVDKSGKFESIKIEGFDMVKPPKVP